MLIVIHSQKGEPLTVVRLPPSVLSALSRCGRCSVDVPVAMNGKGEWIKGPPIGCLPSPTSSPSLWSRLKRIFLWRGRDGVVRADSDESAALLPSALLPGQAQQLMDDMGRTIREWEADAERGANHGTLSDQEDADKP
jgi:hypothetical protein